MKYKSLVLAAAALTACTLGLGTRTANAITLSGVFGITDLHTSVETVGWHHHGGHHMWWHHGGHGYWGGSGPWVGLGLAPFYYGGYGGYYGDYYGDRYGDYYGDRYGGYYGDPYGDYYGDPYGDYGGYYKRHCIYHEHIKTYCH